MLARVSLLALVSLLPARLALAQFGPGGPAEAHHHLVQMHQAHAMDHMQGLYHHAQAHFSGGPVDREVVQEHARAEAEHMAAAQRHIDAEEAAMSDAQRAQARTQLDQIRAAHAEAMARQHEIEVEAARPTPDPHVLADRSAAAYGAMRRAHDGQIAMGRSMGVHDVVVVPSGSPAGAAPPPERRRDRH